MNHLPECQDALIPDFENERWICICKYLRACEDRVRESWYEVQSDTWVQGYAAALNAAREAVAALTTDLALSDQDTVVYRADALAAIDALREKP